MKISIDINNANDFKQKHVIDGRECLLRIPDSQQGDKALRKIYVGYHSNVRK